VSEDAIDSGVRITDLWKWRNSVLKKIEKPAEHVAKMV
jgi:hypothetical protein